MYNRASPSFRSRRSCLPNLKFFLRACYRSYYYQTSLSYITSSIMTRRVHSPGNNVDRDGVVSYARMTTNIMFLTKNQVAKGPCNWVHARITTELCCDDPPAHPGHCTVLQLLRGVSRQLHSDSFWGNDDDNTSAEIISAPIRVLRVT